MILRIKSNWKVLFMEAAGLAGFVCGAGILSIILEHPDSPVMNGQWAKHDMLRRVPLGIIMGGYIAGVILLFGKKSGAHINPSVTWTFYRLGKINLADAILYTIAQFIGAIATSQLLKHTLGKYFGHPLLKYGVSEPKPSYGSTTAFIAEFIISFIMMLVILITITSKPYEKYVALISGVLIALYLIIELPFSGMSLNPARSTGSFLAANQYKYLWIYFIAPTLAMLAAAEIFLVIKKGRFSSNYKINDQEIPTYPIIK
jgi:aquaporin Z